jgi:hypothetical protein
MSVSSQKKNTINEKTHKIIKFFSSDYVDYIISFDSLLHRLEESLTSGGGGGGDYDDEISKVIISIPKAIEKIDNDGNGLLVARRLDHALVGLRHRLTGAAAVAEHNRSVRFLYAYIDIFCSLHIPSIIFGRWGWVRQQRAPECSNKTNKFWFKDGYLFYFWVLINLKKILNSQKIIPFA